MITTIAFHAERSGAGVTGEFECLALAPAEPGTGPGRGPARQKSCRLALTDAPPGHSMHEFGLAVDCEPSLLKEIGFS